jgi:hypothetical protein
MNDIQEIVKGAVNNAVMEGLVKLVLNPYFLKILQASEFSALIDNVSKESQERELQWFLDKESGPRQTAEEQAAALRSQFGEDGMKAVGGLLTGYHEPMIPEAVVPFKVGQKVVIEEPIPKFDRYNFPLRSAGYGIWEIGLNNPRVREAANLSTREFFREQGAISGYDVTDTVMYYVSDFEPSSFVHVHNVSQGKNFRLGTTLEQFNQWFKATSTKLAILAD